MKNLIRLAAEQALRDAQANYPFKLSRRDGDVQIVDELLRVPVWVRYLDIEEDPTQTLVESPFVEGFVTASTEYWQDASVEADFAKLGAMRLAFDANTQTT